MYVSLHNRSFYSFCSALTPPDRLAQAAAAFSMPAVALTDLRGLYGAVAFQEQCRAAGVKPIFGTELHLAGGVEVVLLARDLAGYGNLCRLISLSHLRDAPLAPADLCEHNRGLFCLVGRTELQRDPAEPPLADADRTLHAILAAVRAAFDQRLYVTLCIHTRADASLARRRAKIADALAVPIVATCASRCLSPAQHALLRQLSSVETLTLLDQPHPDKPVGDWRLRSPAEMQRRFARRPDALVNSLAIAEQCNVQLALAQRRFPGFESPDGRSAMEHLRALCLAGVRQRYVNQFPLRGIGGRRPTLAEVHARLARELSIIEEVHYAEYFLVFHEIVAYCRSQGIATLARGSAADSLVCYVLGVSHACPFRFDLPFDRFVNPERAKFSKMADIDLDLPWDQRDQVIRWVYERWGHDRVAMIGSPHTFHARAAVAELGKVFGLPPQEVYRVTKLLPRTTGHGLLRAVARAPEARGLPLDEEPYRTIIRQAYALEGLPRHWSMHPCGLVVAPTPLTDLVPVQPSPKGPLVAQYDMDAIEELGFVKIDLLGQAGLSVLRDSVASLNEAVGSGDYAPAAPIDLTRDVDYADAATWDMIAAGEARGVHHIESPAMTSLIRQCNCRDIDCLTAIVAVIRPGAANQGKKERFARRHQGFEAPTYAHPSVVPVLEKTYGLMVFEEHILQIALEFAGLNLGRADVLRRALNREDRRLLAQLQGEFCASARERGRSEAEIAAVWPLLEGFAGFMFNKAHSAEYAVEAFQGAWLKRRWPAHYLAAILSNYRGFYASSPTLPQILYVLEALRLGATFRPPCVNRSRARFSVEYDEAGRPAIRTPVSHIQGLSQEFIERHLAAREDGPFVDLGDFLARCRPGEADARLLLDAGALDGWQLPRPQIFWQLSRGGRHRPAALWEHAPAPAGGHAPALWGERAPAPEAPPVTLTQPDDRQVARREMELLGFPIRIDPLTFLSRDEQGGWIDWERYMPVVRLGDHLEKRVMVCGLMVADRINRATTGELMKFVTLADRTGFVETHLFPQVYARFGHLTSRYPILTARGVVEPFENRRGYTLRVESVSPPSRGAAQSARTAVQPAQTAPQAVGRALPAAGTLRAQGCG